MSYYCGACNYSWQLDDDQALANRPNPQDAQTLSEINLLNGVRRRQFEESLRDQILSKMRPRTRPSSRAHHDLGRIRLVPSSDRLLRSLKDESFDERMGQDMTKAVFKIRTLSRGHGSIAPSDDYEVRTPNVQECIHYSAEFDRIETQVQGHN